MADDGDNMDSEEYEIIDSEWTHVFPNGDLVIQITDHAKRAIVVTTVWRSVVMRISRPWDKMANTGYVMKSIVTDGYHCKRQPGTYKDSLSVEDDSFSLLIILAAAHPFSNIDVPNNITFEELLTLAVTCDKYDCARAMRKHIRRYFYTHESTATKPGRESWLFISNTFAKRGVFPLDEIRLARQKVGEVCMAIAKSLELPTSQNGGEYGRYGDHLALDRDYIPDHTFELMLSQRKQQVTLAFYELQRYDEFLRTNDWRATVPTWRILRTFPGYVITYVDTVGFDMSRAFRGRMAALGPTIDGCFTGKIPGDSWKMSAQELLERYEEVSNMEYTLATASLGKRKRSRLERVRRWFLGGLVVDDPPAKHPLHGHIEIICRVKGHFGKRPISTSVELRYHGFPGPLL